MYLDSSIPLKVWLLNFKTFHTWTVCFWKMPNVQGWGSQVLCGKIPVIWTILILGWQMCGMCTASSPSRSHGRHDQWITMILLVGPRPELINTSFQHLAPIHCRWPLWWKQLAIPVLIDFAHFKSLPLCNWQLAKVPLFYFSNIPSILS